MASEPNAWVADEISPANDARSLEAEVRDVSSELLAPFAAKYDREGTYPEEAMREFGRVGLYAAHLSGFGASPDVDMNGAINGMAVVGESCLSTAFCVWCQDACGWYLEHTQNTDLKQKFLPRLASGERLGGTGLSNPMKFYSGIERIRLVGRRRPGGYEVRGSLPWVSNLGPDHLFGIVFEVEGEAEHRVMALIDCGQEDVRLGDGGRMIALEGSRTYSIKLRDCFVSDDQILADPADAYVDRIRPGFVLMQTGMGIGLIDTCIEQMERLEDRLGHVNRYLDDRPSELRAELSSLKADVESLARDHERLDKEYLSACLEARLRTGEMTLRAANSSMLHAGARGYLERSAYFRRIREAYFVAVVTPATKHLRRQIELMS